MARTLSASHRRLPADTFPSQLTWLSSSSAVSTVDFTTRCWQNGSHSDVIPHLCYSALGHRTDTSTYARPKLGRRLCTPFEWSLSAGVFSRNRCVFRFFWRSCVLRKITILQQVRRCPAEHRNHARSAQQIDKSKRVPFACKSNAQLEHQRLSSKALQTFQTNILYSAPTQTVLV